MPPEPDPPRRHRRYPDLTRDDVRVLDALAVALGNDAARDFLRFIRRQASSDERWRAHTVPEAAFGSQGLEFARALVTWGHGAGGGTVRRPRGYGRDD